MSDSPLRRLPPVREVLDRPEVARLIPEAGRDAVVAAVREAIEEARGAILGGGPASDPAGLARRAIAIATGPSPGLREAINATGVLLNTGLGRAPMARAAIDRVVATAAGYCNLELDLETGERGRRAGGVEALLGRLTGAEAATVVNNNAAATVLSLRALAIGREVVVSRGQLVEIGGSFRLPEIFEVAGVKLREVGTTNRTRLSDYERAIGPETAALLRVHASNYRIVGFTESVAIGPIAALARDRGLWSIDDVGSGLLREGLPPGVVDEPTAAEGVAAGADVVLFSADKLLGGPQAGLLIGKAAAIDRIKADPLMRALRVDKLTLAALEATLGLIARGEGEGSVPLWALLATPTGRLQARAGAVAASLVALGFAATVEPSEATLGGGTTPASALPSRAVRISPPYPGGLAGASEGDLARSLRVGEPAVVGRVRLGAVWLDLKAMAGADDARVIDRLARLAAD